jgi:hypothetical protein
VLAIKPLAAISIVVLPIHQRAWCVRIPLYSSSQASRSARSSSSKRLQALPHVLVALPNAPDVEIDIVAFSCDDPHP